MSKPREANSGTPLAGAGGPSSRDHPPSADEPHSLNRKASGVNAPSLDTLEHQPITSRDLQNVLRSVDLATILLDRQLNVRFYTPASGLLCRIVPGDVGRPLADLHPLGDDADLLADAGAAMASSLPQEREICTADGGWYVRRVLPFLTSAADAEGVVITFTDVTERRRASEALDAARREAVLASVAKTRFLASASHDLRQPLQTLALLQGLLAKMVNGTKQQELVERVDDAVLAMSGILNTLLDINQIEAGVMLAEKEDFRINDLLERMRDEFTYHAVAQKISLRTVASSVMVYSDRHRLEQMIRNLCSNALKYTRSGKVLLGCRRRGDMLSIEIWDTGLGIAGEELGSIFDEYYQITKPGRERSRGLGLGLSIVKRLSDLLGHNLRVKSQPGRGSVFSVDVPMSRDPSGGKEPSSPPTAETSAALHRTGSILVIEDDPEVLTMLAMLVRDDGHRTATATDGAAALAMIEDGSFQPDLVLADLNLPNGNDGLKVAAQIRHRLHRTIPVVILTGDISTDTLRDIDRDGYVQLHKPANLGELTRTIQGQLALALPFADIPRAPRPRADGLAAPVIYVVDDDPQLRDAIQMVFEADGREVQTYAMGEDFLADNSLCQDGCILIDAHLPGMSGLELLAALRPNGHMLPAIMITGNSEVSEAIAAMKAGATDYIEKPISRVDLLASVERALKLSQNSSAHRSQRDSAVRHIASLTPRQRQIMALVLAGQPSKNIAADLGISQRTVENHRAAIMKKTGARSLPALARLAISADAQGQVALRFEDHDRSSSLPAYSLP